MKLYHLPFLPQSTFLAAGPTLPQTLAPIKLQLIPRHARILLVFELRHVHASTAESLTCTEYSVQCRKTPS